MSKVSFTKLTCTQPTNLLPQRTIVFWFCMSPLGILLVIFSSTPMSNLKQTWTLKHWKMTIQTLKKFQLRQWKKINYFYLIPKILTMTSFSIIWSVISTIINLSKIKLSQRQPTFLVVKMTNLWAPKLIGMTTQSNLGIFCTLTERTLLMISNGRSHWQCLRSLCWL